MQICPAVTPQLFTGSVHNSDGELKSRHLNPLQLKYFRILRIFQQVWSSAPSIA